MELHQWLDENPGKAAWLAAQLGRSKTAVSLWRSEGVPLPLIPRISALTKRAVGEDDMLRHAMRCKATPSAEQATNCACFPGTCRGGEVIDGRTASGQRCKACIPAGKAEPAAAGL
jgi:hypothetical protein